jgi:hypothetical protein
MYLAPYIVSHPPRSPPVLPRVYPHPLHTRCLGILYQAWRCVRCSCSFHRVCFIKRDVGAVTCGGGSLLDGLASLLATSSPPSREVSAKSLAMNQRADTESRATSRCESRQGDRAGASGRCESRQRGGGGGGGGVSCTSFDAWLTQGHWGAGDAAAAEDNEVDLSQLLYRGNSMNIEQLFSSDFFEQRDVDDELHSSAHGRAVQVECS